MSIQFALRQFHVLTNGLAENLLLESAQAAILIALHQIGIGTSMNRQHRYSRLAFKRCRNAA
jgi:hypothetical protein